MQLQNISKLLNEIIDLENLILSKLVFYLRQGKKKEVRNLI